MISNPIKFIISIIIPQLAGAIGSIFTVKSIPNWYANLNKSNLNPPGWVFGPVWTTLFLLMGISLYLIWTAKTNLSKNAAIIFFALQLLLNTSWSIAFFGLKSPIGAFIIILLLIAAIILNIIYFYKISHTAAYLLIPYLIWVSFAMFLNLRIVMLN